MGTATNKLLNMLLTVKRRPCRCIKLLRSKAVVCKLVCKPGCLLPQLSLLCMFAGTQWEQQPERYFGKVHIQVDSQDAQVDAYPTSSDEGSDFSNISQAGSASEDEEDELPFGPARTTKAEDQPQGKSLEIKPAVHYGDIETGTAVTLRLHSVACSSASARLQGQGCML